MEQVYAQALFKMVEGGMEPKKAVTAVRERLIAEGREGLMSRIARAFSHIAQREMQKSGLVLTLAREKDSHAAHKEAKKFLDEMGASAKDLTTRIDETQIGGWRLEGREHLIDASYKKYLLSLYARATNS